MSARGNTVRGGRGAGRGGPSGRGGPDGSGGRGGGQKSDGERPKKENIVDLSKYMGKSLVIKFNGGRQVTGILKGYDQLMNLVLDEVKEVMTDDEGNQKDRATGLLVVRGPMLTSLAPEDGSEEVENPFLRHDDEEE